jgi:hypothetical protein
MRDRTIKTTQPKIPASDSPRAKYQELPRDKWVVERWPTKTIHKVMTIHGKTRNTFKTGCGISFTPDPHKWRIYVYNVPVVTCIGCCKT